MLTPRPAFTAGLGDDAPDLADDNDSYPGIFPLCTQWPGESESDSAGRPAVLLELQLAADGAAGAPLASAVKALLSGSVRMPHA